MPCRRSQTAQRIDAANGTAFLATVYYHGLAGNQRDFGTAISDALFCATGLLLLALLIAVVELIERRRRMALPARAEGTGPAAVPPPSQAVRYPAGTP